jgi:hypothetical protein
LLKISVDTTSGTGTVRAEGQVIGPWVDELARSCEQVLARGTGLIVDLSGISFLDRNGVELLRSLRTRGATIVNSSGFLTEQLKG